MPNASASELLLPSLLAMDVYHRDARALRGHDTNYT